MRYLRDKHESGPACLYAFPRRGKNCKRARGMYNGRRSFFKRAYSLCARARVRGGERDFVSSRVICAASSLMLADFRVRADNENIRLRGRARASCPSICQLRAREIARGFARRTPSQFHSSRQSVLIYIERVLL